MPDGVGGVGRVVGVGGGGGGAGSGLSQPLAAVTSLRRCQMAARSTVDGRGRMLRPPRTGDARRRVRGGVTAGGGVTDGAIADRWPCSIWLLFFCKRPLCWSLWSALRMGHKCPLFARPSVHSPAVCAMKRSLSKWHVLCGSAFSYSLSPSHTFPVPSPLFHAVVHCCCRPVQAAFVTISLPLFSPSPSLSRGWSPSASHRATFLPPNVLGTSTRRLYSDQRPFGSLWQCCHMEPFHIPVAAPLSRR